MSNRDQYTMPKTWSIQASNDTYAVFATLNIVDIARLAWSACFPVMQIMERKAEKQIIVHIAEGDSQLQWLN